MERGGFQFRLATMLLFVACAAFNLWLFRLGALWGIVGLNVSKHVFIAALCQWVGLDDSRANPSASKQPARRQAGDLKVTSIG